jgi:hypothetical protein
LVDLKKNHQEYAMVLLAITILSAWSITSLAAGLGLGAVIRTADKVEKDAFMEALLSTLAERRMAR